MAENGPFGTPFLTPEIPPQKVYVGPLLRSFPGKEARKIFSGGPKWGSRAGAKKLMLKKFLCFCGPLLRPVMIKPVGRIFEISDSNPMRGKCEGPSHPRKASEVAKRGLSKRAGRLQKHANERQLQIPTFILISIPHMQMSDSYRYRLSY